MSFTVVLTTARTNTSLGSAVNEKLTVALERAEVERLRAEAVLESQRPSKSENAGQGREEIFFASKGEKHLGYHIAGLRYRA